MERLKKGRAPIRQSVTKKFQCIKELLATEITSQNSDLLKSNFNRLESLKEELHEIDVKIMDHLLDNDAEDNVILAERESTEKYIDEFEVIKVQVNNIILLPVISSAPSERFGNEGYNHINKRRSFKLPKIELKTFNGDLKEWLGFWSQFRKVHEDDTLHDSDKFQYLLQAMKPDTEPQSIVLSYPQTAENYPKVIEALKERFGRDDLLMQVYVRELLKLVISNATQKDKLPLSTLSIKLESYLRSLSTLNLTDTDPGTWLFPLVESSLPEETLRAWQRSQFSKQSVSEIEPRMSRLDCLMEFIKTEVLNEQQILLAQSGFGSTEVKEKTVREGCFSKVDRKHIKDKMSTGTPTVAALSNTSEDLCIFCEKAHDSEKCYKTTNMTVEERRSKVREKKRCFICLRSNHLSKNCKSNIRCLVCCKKHATVMCPDLLQKDKNESKKEEVSQRHTTSNMACHTSVRQVILQTLMVTVYGNGRRKTVRAFLDCGSQRSYLLKKTAEELGLIACAEELVSHVLFGGSKTSEINHKKYTIKLQKPGGNVAFEFEVRDQSRICQSIPRVSACSALFRELRTKKIWISDVGDNCPEIQLLIGMDIYAKILTGNVVRLKSGLTAIETKLGWTLGGEQTDNSPEVNMANTTITMAYNDGSITDLWNLETIGIQDPVEIKSAEEQDREAKQHLLNTLTQKEDGRYVVGLPWKEGHPEILSNKQIAERRLQSTTQKLEKTGLFSHYGKIFEDWIAEGFIEEVPQEEVEKSCHYLPHRPVIKPESLTTPVRPVFDASCKTDKGLSLNDCLMKGPNYVQIIPEILLRFREKELGVTADIRKAFQMIEVRVEDRDYLRFLWWENFRTMKLKIYRHSRVLFGATCSPFILGAVLDHHLSTVSNKDELIARKLMKSMYVDNCVTSVDSVEEYNMFRSESTRILAEAKMELRCWESTIRNCELSKIESNNEDIESNGCVTKVLGMRWNKRLDTMGVCIVAQFPFSQDILTKRDLLSVIMKIYDVVGFLAPAILPFKLLLQESWKIEATENSSKKRFKSNWDSPLPDVISKEFKQRYQEIGHLEEIEVQRLITGGKTDRQSWSLHTFVDASQHAYGAVVYLRTEDEKGVSVQLVLAKARIAPLKRVTIPRLELLGCLIGGHLASLVKLSLALENVKSYFWSDSTTALAWIRRNEPWHTFVGNRVMEIRQLTDPQHWRHVPGVYNPADLLSRGCYPSELANSNWCEGPLWLRGPEEEWPVYYTNEGTYDEDLIVSEKKKNTDEPVTMMGIDLKRDLTYSQRVRIMGWVLRFYNNARNSRERQNGPLTFLELREAELFIIKCVQGESFPRNGDIICGLKVIQDSKGLVRVKTKITMRNDLFNFRFPLLLPRNHDVVDALIKEQHKVHCHAGIQFLLVQLRKKFWIIQSRRAIRNVISKCMQCKRHRAQHAESETTPLPQDRIKDAAIFEVTGIDLAGPLILKNGSKVWITLYTCAIYRAVHLELVSSLSTEAFLLSLRRFIARRGRPSIIYCDNGTNFVGAANMLKEMSVQKILNESQIQGIEWKFNPPTACWWGGWWERLVRSVKELLKRMLGKSVLTYEELSTSLCDVESVINGRPLTYASEDPEDLTPLTPSMFLHEIIATHVSDLDKLEEEKFRSRLRFRQYLIQELKQRFRKEYLSQLVQRPKGKKASSLKEGDMVLLGSEKLKRVEWPLARILTLFPGRDGAVRVAKLKTKDGVLIRPIERLYPLEIDSEQTIFDRKSDLQTSRQSSYVTKSGREVIPNSKYSD